MSWSETSVWPHWWMFCAHLWLLLFDPQSPPDYMLMFRGARSLENPGCHNGSPLLFRDGSKCREIICPCRIDKVSQKKTQPRHNKGLFYFSYVRIFHEAFTRVHSRTHVIVVGGENTENENRLHELLVHRVHRMPLLWQDTNKFLLNSSSMYTFHTEIRINDPYMI